MIVLSLFDGISAARVALERSGHKIERYYASEINKYAIKIAQKNYPDTVQLGDVTKIHITNFGLEIDQDGSSMRCIDVIPDFICGGSPCQGFSKAGKGRNFNDPRSALFFEFVRILNECKAVNPDVKFILENVDMKREWRNIITKHLGVQPIFLDSKVLSAQQRQRRYWCNFIPLDKYYDVCHPKDRGIVLNDIMQDESEVYEKYYLSDHAIQRIKIRGNRQQSARFNEPEGKSATIDSHPSGGFNHKVMIQSGRGKNKGGEHTDKSTTVTSNRWEQNNYLKVGGVINEFEFKANKANNIDSNYYKGADNHGQRTVIQVNDLNEFSNQPRQQNRVYDVNGKSPAHLAELSSGTHSINTNRIRRLTHIEVERLFGLKDGYTEGVSDSRRYHALGNSWQVDTVAHIFNFL